MSDMVEQKEIGGLRVSLWEKVRENGESFKWMQVSRFDKASSRWLNVPIFKNELEIFGLLADSYLQKLG